MSAPASNPHTQGKGGGGRKGRRKEEKKADRKEGVYIPMTAFLDYYAWGPLYVCSQTLTFIVEGIQKHLNFFFCFVLMFAQEVILFWFKSEDVNMKG